MIREIRGNIAGSITLAIGGSGWKFRTLAAGRTNSTGQKDPDRPLYGEGSGTRKFEGGSLRSSAVRVSARRRDPSYSNCDGTCLPRKLPSPGTFALRCERFDVDDAGAMLVAQPHAGEGA